MTSPLALPAVIEELSFEAILAAFMADATTRFAAAGIAYDVGNLEYDPVKIVLEAAAYRETLLRARVNDAARANLLSFATGTDLDHLAAFYDVARLAEETDAALRERVVLTIQGRSAAGPEERYAAVARAVDVRIVDVRVYQVDGGPALEVALLTSDNNGVPDAQLIADVAAALNATDVRAINDQLSVVAAVSDVVDIEADVWLKPDAPQSLFETLPDLLTEAWGAEGGIGADLVTSWIEARLHVDGVSRVEVRAPAASIVAEDNDALAIGAVTLVDKGRAR